MLVFADIYITTKEKLLWKVATEDFSDKIIR